MFSIHGQEKTDEEVRRFVEDYLTEVKGNTRTRYHGLLSLVQKAGSGRALDYGCGWGHYSIALADKGFTVEGIDLSANEIGICQLVWGQRANVRFTSTPISDFTPSSFDLVLSSQVIEHVHNVGNYLSGINRVLRPGAVLAISLPNVMTPRFILGALTGKMKKNLAAISEKVLTNYEKGSDHINAWDPAHFVRMVSSVGFRFDEYLPMEGLAMPFSRYCKPYLQIKGRRLENLSYTMAFRFVKEKDSAIGPMD